MRKARASLIAALCIGLLAVVTAGVSTYAWFQSGTNANIVSDDDDVDITITAPDDVEVSNTEVYMYRGDPTSKNVTSHYTLVDTVLKRTIENFYPGEKITFAIKVTGTTITSGSMDLTYRGYSLSNRTIYGTSGESLKVISILSAIKVMTGANSTGSYPSMTQKLTPLARGSEPLLSSLTRVSATTSYYKQATINNAIDSVSIGATTAYFFYTIEFLNTASTFYLEKNSTGSSNITTPTDASGTRYFTGDNSGGSTCYEGLKFDITSAAITVA